MKNHINQNYLNNAADAVRWYRPESENEFKLIELLRETLALQDDIEQLHSDKEELQAELESVNDKLIDYKNAWSDITSKLNDCSAYRYPTDEPNDSGTIEAIMEAIEGAHNG